MTTMNPATFTADIPYTVALAAHAGTSQVPERRAEQVIAEYANTLASDLAELTALAAKHGTSDLVEVEFARYREGYGKRYRAYLGTRSRIVSWLVAGPAKFPTRRMEKANRVSDARCADLLDFRKRALAAIKRTLTPELQPVKASDPNAVERLDSKVEKAEKTLASYKLINATIRKAKKGGPEAQVAALMEQLGYSEATARKLLTPDFAGRIGIPSYEITNLAANIRRMKGRAVVVAEAQATEATEIEGTAARFEDAPADNRVRLFFPGKPEADVRGRLKAAGFRWAPSLGCWQAYRNHRSITTAKAEAGIA